MENSISLDQLIGQMTTLESDEKKTMQKLFEIAGAKKVIQFLIDEVKTNGSIQG